MFKFKLLKGKKMSNDENAKQPVASPEFEEYTPPTAEQLAKQSATYLIIDVIRNIVTSENLTKLSEDERKELATNAVDFGFLVGRNYINKAIEVSQNG